MAQHLLGIENFSREELLAYLENAESFVEISDRDIKKVPSLRGKTVVNLFLEPSTRTRVSFEIAAKRLSADVISISPQESSINKGESLLDTAQTIEAMKPDVLVIRHSESGAASMLSRYLNGTSVVNAGDGLHEHPTQALLDCLTLKQRFPDRFDGGLNIAIVGDVLHSRVARSNIFAHRLLGNKLRLVGPPTLLPQNFGNPATFNYDNITIHHSLSQALEGVDVIIALRMQLERQVKHFVPSLREYSRNFCINKDVLSRFAPEAVVLHPGPVNRGVEVSGDVAYGHQSLVSQQVSNGIAVRMAVLFMLTSGVNAKVNLDVKA